MQTEWEERKTGPGNKVMDKELMLMGRGSGCSVGMRWGWFS